jgi:hypothetical protein
VIKVKRVTATSAGLTLWAALFGSIPAAQHSGTKTIDQLVSLSAFIDVRGLDYSHDSTTDATVTYMPGPYNISVSLGNMTETPLVFRRERRDWSESLSMTVRRSDQSQLQPLPGARLRRSPGSQRHAVTQIEARTVAREQFMLDMPQPFQPGEYRLIVQVNETELNASARRFKNILKHELVLRVVEAASPLERLDRFLQLSYQAARADQHAQSRQWAHQALALNPQSIAALSDIGQAFLAEGNCVEARTFMTRVRDLLTSGADPGLRLLQSARQELDWAMRDNLAKRCGP